MRGRCSGGVSGILSIMRRVKGAIHEPHHGMSGSYFWCVHARFTCLCVRLHNLATSAALKALFRV